MRGLPALSSTRQQNPIGLAALSTVSNLKSAMVMPLPAFVQKIAEPNCGTYAVG
jgi:hypothetical protein